MPGSAHEGHPRVIILSKNDGLESSMLHTDFRENRPAGSGEEVVLAIYGRGGHLGHVTQISQTNFRSPYP